MLTFKLSERAVNTPSSPIRRLAPLAAKAKKEGVKVYHLNIGQPDIESPQTFFEGIKDFQSKIVAYENSRGNPFLCDAWAKHYKDILSIDISPENILITQGASEALIFIFMICCDPGDEIVIFDPTYANYLGFAAISGVVLKPVETSLKNNFALPPPEIIEQSISGKTKAILLCNPNNPTGTVYSSDELQSLVEICNKYHLFLIVDETYRELVYDAKKPLSIFNVAYNNDKVMVIDSLSKRFSLCGARIGSLITSNAEILKAALNLAQARLSVSSIEQHAAAYMLNNLESTYVDSMRAEFCRRRNVLFDCLNRIPDITVHKPEGAFYCIVKLPVLNAEDFCTYMLREFRDDNETLFLAPAGGFYMKEERGIDKVRIAYVLSEENLRRAILILEKGLRSYLSKI
jgi:aspartate aminotransferase